MTHHTSNMTFLSSLYTGVWDLNLCQMSHQAWLCPQPILLCHYGSLRCYSLPQTALPEKLSCTSLGPHGFYTSTFYVS